MGAPRARTGCSRPSRPSSPRGNKSNSPPRSSFSIVLSIPDRRSVVTIYPERTERMTISTLDEKSALLVVDLQKGIAGLQTAHPMTGVVASAVTLADAFRERGLPVVLINADAAAPGRTEQARPNIPMPAGWTDFLPELKRQASDHVVTKRTWGAFTGTDLKA